MEVAIQLKMSQGWNICLVKLKRCWANETACAVGIELAPDIPKTTISYDLYKPDYKLHV